MEIKNGDRIYTVTETAKQWNIKTDLSKLGVSYSVPKEVCKTFFELKRYVELSKLF